MQLSYIVANYAGDQAHRHPLAICKLGEDHARGLSDVQKSEFK